MTSIEIPDSVISIGEETFSGCNSLKSVKIPHSIIKIGTKAFFGCDRISFLFWDSDLSPSCILRYCDKEELKTVVLGDNLTNIEEYAFRGCSGLTSVTIPNSVTRIGGWAFENCSSLSSITIPNSVFSIGYYAFQGCTSLTTISIPKSVNTIADCAFSKCTSLTGITISNPNLQMGKNVFLECTSRLSYASIPNTLNYSFNECYGLRHVDIHIETMNSETKCINFASGVDCHYFYNGEELIGDYVIPNDVTNFNASAIYKCKYLTSLTIPSTVIQFSCNSSSCIGTEILNTLCINSQAVLRKTYTSELNLSSCIGPNLKCLYIGESAHSVSNYAFSNCNSLISVSIPYSVTSIGSNAFSGCNNVESLYWNSNISPTCLIQYCRDKLKTVILGNDIASIDGFNGCSSLVSINIPNSVTSIGSSAFSGCSSLASIEIPNSVTDIGSNAFKNCSSLTSIEIPYSVTSIGSNAFSGCNNVESLYWNSNISPTCLIQYCRDKLKTVILGNDIASIDGFNGCSSLVSINIPNSVTSIGSYAFCQCNSLTSIEIPNSVTSIGSYAFCQCNSLTSIEIPNSVTSIGEWAFYNCSGLTSIALPNSVTSIGKYAFGSCGGMTSIIIPNSVTSIGDYAFEGCSGLKSLEMSANIQEVGTHAFDGCNVFECERLEIGQLYAKFKTSTIFTSSAGIKVKINDSEANAADGIIIVKDKPNTYFSGPCKVYCNGTVIYQLNVNYRTNSMQLKLTYESNPTQITISSFSYIEEDAKVVKAEVWNPITGEFVTGGALRLTNLAPNSSYNIPYRVYYGMGENDYEGSSTYVYTNSLTLKTETPKVVNSTSAVVAATTNIPDDEVSVGFEWRKIDAPEEIPSKSGGAVIYNGRMEGKIMNLQTDSYYKVRAYYESREGKKYYGEWVGFDPSDFSYFEPTVHTYAMASAQTSNSVKVRGYAVAGTDDLDEQGFEYNEVGSSAEPKRVSATGQLMTATLEGLKYNTSYNVRAYVKTSSKTVYGETVTFKTPYTDGIEEITVDAVQERTIQGVYDMQGRLISRDSNIDLSTLKQGIYIVNGKKVLIK